MSLTDTIATSASFAARRGEDVDPNQEMIGLGAANLTAGFLQGFAVSTSGSRTAVAEQSGAKSQLTGLVGAGLVVTLLVLFQSLLADLPQSALAAVVIAAALSLLNLGVLRRYASVRRSALLLSLTASVGVIVLGVLQGIVLAIVLSVLLFFRRSWWPHGAVVGRVEGIDGWHSVEAFPEPRPRSRASWCTAGRRRSSSPTPARSATRSAGSSTTATRRGSSSCAKRSPTSTSPPRACSNSSTVELNADGVHLAFVEMRTRLQDLVERYGLLQTLDSEPLLPERRGGARGDRGGGAMSDTIRRERVAHGGARPPSGASSASSVLALMLVVILFRHADHLTIGLVGLVLAAAGGWWIVTERMPRRAFGVVGVAGRPGRHRRGDRRGRWTARIGSCCGSSSSSSCSP